MIFEDVDVIMIHNIIRRVVPRGEGCVRGAGREAASEAPRPLAGRGAAYQHARGGVPRLNSSFFRRPTTIMNNWYYALEGHNSSCSLCEQFFSFKFF